MATHAMLPCRMCVLPWSDISAQFPFRENIMMDTKTGRGKRDKDRARTGMCRLARKIASLIALSVAASSAYPASIEPYSCRNGLFPAEGQNTRLYRVVSEKPVYLHDDDQGCPALAKCQKNAYLVKANEVLVSKIQEGWACVWYQGKKSEHVGWMPAESLQEAKEIPIRNADWVGTWRGSVAWIKIAKTQGPKLRITGFSSWSSPTTTNIGEIDGFIQPEEKLATMEAGDNETDCVVELTRVGRYLIASDNRNCGGMNVNFDDVYLRK